MHFFFVNYIFSFSKFTLFLIFSVEMRSNGESSLKKKKSIYQNQKRWRKKHRWKQRKPNKYCIVTDNHLDYFGFFSVSHFKMTNDAECDKISHVNNWNETNISCGAVLFTSVENTRTPTKRINTNEKTNIVKNPSNMDRIQNKTKQKKKDDRVNIERRWHIDFSHIQYNVMFMLNFKLTVCRSHLLNNFIIFV